MVTKRSGEAVRDSAAVGALAAYAFAERITIILNALYRQVGMPPLTDSERDGVLVLVSAVIPVLWAWIRQRMMTTTADQPPS